MLFPFLILSLIGVVTHALLAMVTVITTLSGENIHLLANKVNLSGGAVLCCITTDCNGCKRVSFESDIQNVAEQTLKISATQ
jgi:hypothetical protein